MKRAVWICFFGLVFCLSYSSAQASDLKTVDSGICTGVENHKAVGIGDAFNATVGKLYCFTRVVGPYLAEKQPYVVHVWYYKNTERARIKLPIKSSNWGTFSSKIIQPFESGSWHVNVLDSKGQVISVFQFFIK